MHDKEKEELIYKITTLENTLNRIKSSLNDQMAQMKIKKIKIMGFPIRKNQKRN